MAAFLLKGLLDEGGQLSLVFNQQHPHGSYYLAKPLESHEKSTRWSRPAFQAFLIFFTHNAKSGSRISSQSVAIMVCSVLVRCRGEAYENFSLLHFAICAWSGFVRSVLDGCE